MALGSELPLLMADAQHAHSLEDAGDLEGAAIVYLKACAQLQYLMDVCVPRTQPDIAAVCDGLLAAWRARLEVRCCMQGGTA